MEQKPVSLIQAITRLNQVLLLDRKDIGVIYLFVFFAGIVQLSLPLGIQSIINFVMAGSLSTSIVVLIGLVVFGVFINGLLQVRQLQVMEKVKQKLFVRYSMEYGSRIPQLDIEKLDKEYLPEMVNRYFDTVSLQKALEKLLIEFPTAIMQVLLGLILLAFYHPIFIAFGALLLFIVAAILLLTSSRGLVTALTASGCKYAVAAWLQEVARTVKSFKYTKGTSLHIKRTDDLVSHYLVSRTQHFKILLTQFWSLISFKIIVTAAMLIIGSYLLVNQQINVGQFIAADIVIIAIIGSIEKLITNLDTVYDALVSVEKLSLVANAEKEQSGSLQLDPKAAGVDIEFNNVSFSYGSGKPVLQNIQLLVKKGEFVQLKGASGSGKSTLLRLLTGAFVGYSGNILIEGIPSRNYNIQSLRQLTGILLGSQDIFQGSLLENITMGDPRIRIEDVNKLAEISGLSSFVLSCKEGYDTILQPVGNKLSRNVRRNILLMRALLGENRLLLLEEPFGHLEQPFKSQVIDYIKQSKNATILVASDSDELTQYCDRVIHINKQGEIVS